MEYTYADVIIDPNDLRVEIGKEYYFGDNVGKLLWGVRAGWETEVLRNVYKVAGTYEPFYNGRASFSCIIRKKEPKKRYVPFDLSKEEDRNFLKGRWIKTDGDEEKITGFERDDDGVWHIKISADYLLSEDMLNLWRFEDNTLCGKLVEETE